jgi:RNA polymerase sigma-70 factor (ECF subfamily)
LIAVTFRWNMPSLVCAEEQVLAAKDGNGETSVPSPSPSAEDGNGAKSVPSPSPSADPVDQAIARALAAGDANAALPLLMDRYGDSIFRYCRRMLGSDAEAEDASQVVFEQAFKAIRRRARVENVGAWLQGIARHRCLDELNRRRRAPVPVEQDELERVVEAEGTCEIDVSSLSDRQHLDECLDALEERDRMVVLLRFYDHLSYDEISKKTGDTPGALRVRFARALISLRQCMKKKASTS